MQIDLKCKTTILFFLVSFNIIAQDFELFKVQSAYYPNQTIEDSEDSREIGFWEWNAQLAIPQRLKNEKTVLLHQLSYTNLRADVEGILPNDETEANKDFHAISYSLNWIQTLDPKWKLAVNLSPTFASDFDQSLSTDDFFFLGNALAIKMVSTKFKYGFGLAYTTNFGRQLVIPMGMISYRTNNMALDIILPNRLSVVFNMDKAFHYGFQARLDGAFFNNTSAIQIVNDEIDRVGYSRLNIGPKIVFRFNETIKINLEGGMAIARRLDFVDAEGETFDRTPENGPFFKVGLSLSPKRK
ncbi:MAG: DUF6268 family outer membrane beta-barrel protein [Bacteroidota bacterium]